jgi:hypothetical protein
VENLLDKGARLTYIRIMSQSHSSDEGKGDAKPLSLRDFPKDLYWKCKELAARRRMSLKDYVIEALEEAVRRDSKGTRPT